MSLSARFMKLPDGTWGLRVTGLPAPRPGQWVPVLKKDGSVTLETVGEIIMQSGALTICRHVPLGKACNREE